MLLAYSQKEPRLRDLFRDHYRFQTSNGPLRWREIVALQPKQQRSLYVLSDDNPQLQAQAVAEARKVLLITATEVELRLLEDFASTDNYRVVSASRLLADHPSDEVPAAFQRLAQRLAAPLHRHGIPRVTVTNLPGFNAPVLCETTGEGRHADNSGRARFIRLAGVQLNIANPLIEALAMRAESLDAEALARAAELLFYIAILKSPFQEARDELADRLVTFLAHVLERELMLPKGVGGSRALCCVALPQRPDFAAVGQAAHAVLGTSCCRSGSRPYAPSASSTRRWPGTPWAATS